MKNLKIGKKLLLSFGIVVLLIITLGASALFGLSRMDSVVTLYGDKTVPNTEYIWHIRRNLLSIERYMLQAITNPTVEGTATIVELADAEAAAFTESINIYRNNMRTDPALLDEVEKYWEEANKIRVEIENISKNADAESNSRAYTMYTEKFLPIADTMNDKIVEISDIVKTLSIEQREDASDTTFMILILILTILSVSVVLAVVMGILIQKSIARPVKEISTAMTALTNGDLDNAHVDYTSRDELGQLSEDMRNLSQRLRNIIHEVSSLLGEMGDGNFRIKSDMEEIYVGSYRDILSAMQSIQRNLSDTLSKINQASDQVSIGSEQVSSGAQALSQGATEQASSLEELSATITELSQQISNTASGAREASGTVEGVANEINSSNEHMQQLILAMGDITQKSGEIGKIIKTIEDIAFQTNILALNAAVEAARAGAAGKGFAVVADEVRNLASKSAEAAKTTTSLIEGTITAVEAGTKIADETAIRLTQVVEGAKSVVGIVEHIDSATNEQALAVSQVTTGVDQISSVVQTNSATAEQSAAASEELFGQASMLKNMVSQFKLLDGNNSISKVTPSPLNEISKPIEISLGDKY